MAPAPAPRKAGGLDFRHPGGKEWAVGLLGVAALALAYYLYKKNQASTAATQAAASSATSPTGLFASWYHDHMSSPGTSSSGTITVPNVVGMTDTAGDAAITAAGLVVKDANEKPGGSGGSTKITAQSPAAGTKVKAGSTVTVTLATPAKKSSGGDG